MEVAVTPSNVYVGDPGWEKPKCANVITSEGSVSRNCINRGTQTCKGCYLVMYCGKDCRLANQSQHRKDCRSSLLNINWKPRWGTDGRIPTFISSSPQPVETFGAKHYLWGNMPAIDVLNISENEGDSYERDLALCFAASGDLRNIICSILGTPANVPTLCCIVNDRDLYVVARNVIFFLIAMRFPATAAAELMIHLWYSARLTEEMLKAIETTIRPLIADMVEKIEGKREDILLLRRWMFGPRQLVVLLCKRQWSFLLQFMDARHLPSHTEARRRDVMLNANRRDYGRYLFRLPPKQRICHSKFRETGTLLPFGNCSEGNIYPNPLLFEPQDGRWLQRKSDNPLTSWSVKAVRTADTAKIGPSGDHIGHLYYYIRDKLTSFCQRIETLQAEFHMYQVDALQLPSILKDSIGNRSFDRIEVSNIVDKGRLGLAPVLSVYGPLLKTRKQNPYSCLITLFMNAIPELFYHTRNASHQKQTKRDGATQARRFIKNIPQRIDKKHPTTLRIKHSAKFFWDFDKLLSEYLQEIQSIQVGRQCGLRTKDTNSIVERWPLRLKKRYDENGALEAFEDLEVSMSTSSEFYLEWVREESE